MKKHTLRLCLPALLGLVLNTLAAQTPTDAVMMEKGQICLAAVYTHDAWDHYWEGTLKRDNGNVGTFTRQSVMPMFALGVVNRINVIAALPWMHTSASGGQVRGASGLQDWGVWIKGEVLKHKAGPGNFSIHTTLGITGPASNYLEDFMPFSLGLGCLDGTLRGVLQYHLDKGPFLRVTGGYHLRGNCKIERDYYYTTTGYYTDEVDMPDAFTYEVVAGSWLLNNSLRVEARYDGMKTLGGFDIRRQDAGFPSNKMIFTRIGAGVQYYLPFVKGLGLLASGSYVLSGRNVGQSTAFSCGLTYQFGLWK